MNILSKFIAEESEMIVKMFAQYISTYLGMNICLSFLEPTQLKNNRGYSVQHFAKLTGLPGQEEILPKTYSIEKKSSHLIIFQK